MTLLPELCRCKLCYAADCCVMMMVNLSYPSFTCGLVHPNLPLIQTVIVRIRGAPLVYKHKEVNKHGVFKYRTRLQSS